MKKIICAILLLLPLCGWAKNNVDNSAFNWSFAVWVNEAALNGFMQIPTGGLPGTSSVGRPTFSELGIDTNTNYNFSLQGNWHNWGLYGIYNYNRPSGTNTLTQSLVTHGVTFPAGTQVTTNTNFDLYRLGFLYNFYLLQNRWQLYPLLEGTLLTFNYNISSTTAATARAFNQSTVRIGFGGKYFFTPNFFWDFELASSIPNTTNLSVQTASTHLDYTVAKSQSIATTFFAGIAYNRYNFQDKQTLPNHIRLTEWPSGEFGLRLSMS